MTLIILAVVDVMLWIWTLIAAVTSVKVILLFSDVALLQGPEIHLLIITVTSNSSSTVVVVVMVLGMGISYSIIPSLGSPGYLASQSPPPGEGLLPEGGVDPSELFAPSPGDVLPPEGGLEPPEGFDPPPGDVLPPEGGVDPSEDLGPPEVSDPSSHETICVAPSVLKQ